jgi:hypothetical protein
MTPADVLNLVVGSVFLVWGMVLVVFCGRLTRGARRMQAFLFGELGRRTAEGFSPGLTAVCGAFFAVFGSIVLVRLLLDDPLLPPFPV